MYLYEVFRRCVIMFFNTVHLVWVTADVPTPSGSCEVPAACFCLSLGCRDPEVGKRAWPRAGDPAPTKVAPVLLPSRRLLSLAPPWGLVGAGTFLKNSPEDPKPSRQQLRGTE